MLGPAAASGWTWTPTGLDGLQIEHLVATDDALYAGATAPFSEAIGIWRLDVVAPAPEWVQVGLAGQRVRRLGVSEGRNGDADTLVAVRYATFGQIPGPLVQRSYDGGATWEPADAGLPIIVSGAYGTDPRDFATQLLSDDGSDQATMYRTEDMGKSWTAVTQLAGWDVAFSPTSDFAVATSVNSFGAMLGESYDRGVTWSFQISSWVGPISFDPSGVAYVGSYQKILRRATPTAEWEQLPGPDDIYLYNLLVSQVDPAVIIAATRTPVGAVYASLDGWSTWSDITSGLPEGASPNPIVDGPPGTGTIYIGTGAHGVWRLDLPDIVSVESPTAPPAPRLRVRTPASGPIVFELSAVPEPSSTELTVLDASGRVVRRWHPAGERRIHWTDRRVGPGVYFVVLEGLGRREVEKLVLLD